MKRKFKTRRSLCAVVRNSIQVCRKTGCWNWIGYVMPNGYGYYKKDYAHRLVYEALAGFIEKSMQIDHLCRNRRCCNPRHLEEVTARDNLLRSPITVASINAAKTHCPKGHPLSGDNLLIRRKQGGRYLTRACRECHNCRQRKRYTARALILGLKRVNDEEGA